MTRLLILTTATNRGDLHKHVFLGYKRFLTSKNVYDDGIKKIVWVVNIDRIDDFTTSVDFVQRRIEKIFSNRKIDFRWLIRPEGNFYKAVRTLFKQGVKIINDDIAKEEGEGEAGGVDAGRDWKVLYLEDDWWYRDCRHIDFFTNMMKRERLDYLELRKCPTPLERYTYFAPSLWSSGHFFRVASRFLAEKPNRRQDPEQICKRVLWKRGGEVQHVFIDIGRDWLTSHGLTKNNNKKLRGARNMMYNSDTDRGEGGENDLKSQ